MKSFSQIIWKKVVGFLGEAALLVRPVAKQIKILKDAGDVEGLRKVATEGLEAIDAEREVYLGILNDTEDGTLDLAETGDLAILVERWVDEREDQITGHDEDDAPAPKKKVAKKATTKKK